LGGFIGSAGGQLSSATEVNWGHAGMAGLAGAMGGIVEASIVGLVGSGQAAVWGGYYGGVLGWLEGLLYQSNQNSQTLHNK
jgi:hypothetical protein